jgi:hypothetical protein
MLVSKPSVIHCLNPSQLVLLKFLWISSSLMYGVQLVTQLVGINIMSVSLMTSVNLRGFIC